MQSKGSSRSKKLASYEKTESLPWYREVKMNKKRSAEKAVRERFFLEFSQYHCEWLRDLVRQYKEYGVYPVLPTNIAEYYPNKEDKEIALFSTFCMSWTNDNELEQIASMRELIGKHPAEWFRNREFITISVGREQGNFIGGYRNGRYWKIAKVFDLLYVMCHREGKVLMPSEALTVESYNKYCDMIANVCELRDMDRKKGIVELVLRSSDGIGRGLWVNTRKPVRCPLTSKTLHFVKEWFPDWTKNLWPFDEVVKLFRLEHDYDLFYAALAYEEQASLFPDAYKKYATRYHTIWKNQAVHPRHYWISGHGITPIIKFE